MTTHSVTNPPLLGDSWLYDEASNGYKYYQHLLQQQPPSSSTSEPAVSGVSESSSSSNVQRPSKLEPPIPPQPPLPRRTNSVHPMNTTHSFDSNSPPPSTKRRRRRRFSAHPAAESNVKNKLAQGQHQILWYRFCSFLPKLVQQEIFSTVWIFWTL